MSDTESIEARLVGCFEVIFPELTEDAIRSAEMSADIGWDSLASISLISVIEEEFDLQFGDDIPETIKSFADARSAVEAASAQA